MRSRPTSTASSAPESQAVAREAYKNSVAKWKPLNGEFRRRLKTQASLPTEDSALVLLFSLLASGQVKLRRIDGWQDIAHVLSQHARRCEIAA